MTAALCVSVLLVALCVPGGKCTTSDDSHCTYSFKVPAADCSQTCEDQVLKSSVIGLQAQIKLLTKEIATIKAGMSHLLLKARLHGCFRRRCLIKQVCQASKA